MEKMEEEEKKGGFLKKEKRVEILEEKKSGKIRRGKYRKKGEKSGDLSKLRKIQQKKQKSSYHIILITEENGRNEMGYAKHIKT